MWPSLRAPVCCCPHTPCCTSQLPCFLFKFTVGYYWPFFLMGSTNGMCSLAPSLHSACCSDGPELTAPSNPSQSASAPPLCWGIWPLTQVCNVMIRDPPDSLPPPTSFFFFVLVGKKQNGRLIQNYQDLTGSRWEYSSSDLTPCWGVVDWKPLRLHLLPTLTEGREGMMTVPVHSQIPFCIANAFLPCPTKITCGRRGNLFQLCTQFLFFFFLAWALSLTFFMFVQVCCHGFVFLERLIIF